MNESSPTSDFLASRSAASAGPDPLQYLSNRFGGGASTPAVSTTGDSGTTPAAPAAPNANLPMGLRMEQAVVNFGKKFQAFQDTFDPVKGVLKPVLDRAAEAGAAINRDLTTALPSERTDPLNPETEHVAPGALPDRIMQTAGDAANVLSSPISGVIKKTFGPLIEKLTGGKISADDVASDADIIAQVAAGSIKNPEAAGGTAARGGSEAAPAAEGTASEGAGPPGGGAPQAASGSIPISSANVPGESPIVRFQQDASAIQEATPAPQEGFTRLWRGNRPGETGSATSFTNDLPGIALPFREAYKGDLSFVDVPTSDLAQYENKGAVAPGAEFSLPEDIASSATPVSVSTDKAIAADAVQGSSISEAASKNGAVDADGLPLEDIEELKRAGMASEPFKINNESPDKLNVTPELQEQFRKYLNGESGESPVQPSLEKLGTKEGLEDAITQLATFIPRSGIKTDSTLRSESMQMLLGLSPDDLLNGPIGSIAKDTSDLDARMDAAKILVMSGAEQLRGLAIRANMPGATDADWQAATRAYALQNQITKMFSDAGTNVGRALRARQLDVFGEGSAAQAFNDIVANVGPENIEEVIRKMAALPTPEQVSGWTGTLRKMVSRDGLLYGWYNVLLGPATIAKKLTSDAVVGTLNVASRYVAEKLGSGAVAPGETAALVSGYAGSIMDGLSAAAKAMRSGHSNFMSDYQTMDGTTVTRMEKLVGDGDAQVDAQHPTNAAFALLRAGLPTTWIGAADDLAKVMNYRAEARSLLQRQGVAQDLEGDALSQHINDGLANMPDDIHAQAKAAALSNTFQDPLTGIAANLQDTMDSLNLPIGTPSLGWKGFEVPVGRMLMPFVKVPANIMKFVYRNSPLPLAFPSAGFKAELAAGGAQRDLAYARVGIGTGISMAASGLAISGNLTGAGPSEPSANAAWQRAGNMPYSIKIGGQSYGYNKVEPIGMMLAAVADTFNVMKFAKDEDNENVAASMVFGLGDAILSKTYMSGIANFFDALNAPEQESSRYVDNLIASMAVPNTVGSIDKATDKWRRAHYDLLGAIEAKTPGLSEGMPPVRTIWGDPIPQDQGFAPPFTGTGAARALSPIPERPNDAQPIDSWIWDNRQSFPIDGRGNIQLPSKPGHTQTFMVGKIDAHVALSSEQYSRFVELSGNTVKDGNGLGAKDYLNALVSGDNPDSATQRQWNNGSPAVKAVIVQSAVGKFRQAAKQQLRSEFPDIEQAINAQATDRAGQLTGAPQ